MRYLWANPIAWQAAKDGKPLPDGSVLLLEQHAANSRRQANHGSDGFFVSDRVLGFALMGHGPGWGKDIPEILRNGDWNYAGFTPDMNCAPASAPASALPAINRSTRRTIYSRTTH